jgi:aryl-phospho-beta-D-glucosidase BglC (GH1 family)
MRLAVPLLCLLATLCLPPSPVRAAAPAPLALPASIFPAAATIQRHADTPSTTNNLHTQPFAQLGEASGYSESATWSPVRGSRVTLHYHGSIYADQSRAAAVFGDARQTLWEYGIPTRNGSRMGFKVSERRGMVDMATVIHHGSMEMELQLTYKEAIAAGGIRSALGVLNRATAAASGMMQGAGSGVNRNASPSDPPVSVAPPGAGPVVKSPSLMVMPSTAGGTQTAADPGDFRTGSPAIAASVATPRLITPGAISRYAVTATDSTGGQWYNSAALYPDSASASAALSGMPGKVVSPWGVSEARAWQQGDEKVLAFRVDNVVEVLAGYNVSPGAQSLLAQQIVKTIPTWLHADSTQIVDARGTPVRLAALNWYGAESPDYVVGGLDYRSYQKILQTISDLGYNTIRLPFSNQLVEQNPVVTAHLGANPQLQGLHALDILDTIVNYAGALGMYVILDNHRSEAGWSSEANGLWYTPQYSDASFVADWSIMAARYAGTNAVVGLDLRNEPHGTASWGDGNPATDWHDAAQRAGDAALSANPNVLIIVEGIQYYGTAPSAWWGANLMGVAAAPIQLQYADGRSARDRLVYSAHEYGPNMCGSGCPWFNSTTTYASLTRVWDSYFGFIVAKPVMPYSAPVWLGEFGTCNLQKTCVADTTPGSQGQWFASLVQYIGSHGLGWAYWSANGTQSSGPTRMYGQAEGYGLLSADWTTPTPYVQSALQGILGAS